MKFFAEAVERHGFASRDLCMACWRIGSIGVVARRGGLVSSNLELHLPIFARVPFFWLVLLRLEAGLASPSSPYRDDANRFAVHLLDIILGQNLALPALPVLAELIFASLGAPIGTVVQRRPGRHRALRHDAH
jgi:hypothetical protein